MHSFLRFRFSLIPLSLVAAACATEQAPDGGGLATTAGALAQPAGQECKSQGQGSGRGHGQGQGGDHGQDEKHGQGCNAPKTACEPTSDVPSPVDATLPGESAECTELGVAACSLDFSAYHGEEVYRCFDATGNWVMSAGESEAATAIPCSKAQLDAWVAAYATPCWKSVALEELATWPVTLLLDPASLPAQLCSNIDGTAIRFSAACADHLATLEHAQGVVSGNIWLLHITPPTTGSLKTGYPFVDCAAYAAVIETGAHASVSVVRTSEELLIRADDVAGGGPDVVDWPAVFNQLAEAFTKCNAVYEW